MTNEHSFPAFGIETHEALVLLQFSHISVYYPSFLFFDCFTIGLPVFLDILNILLVVIREMQRATMN